MLNFKLKKEETIGCCSVQAKGKVACPKCKVLAKGVLGKTVENLLTQETKSTFSCFEGFHFCKTATCEVVYFRDEYIVTQKEMSVVVGHKEGAIPATVCYCFDWTKEKIKAEIDATGNSTALDDIKEKMECIGCSCELLNPSGGCCLGNVGKVISLRGLLLCNQKLLFNTEAPTKPSHTLQAQKQ